MVSETFKIILMLILMLIILPLQIINMIITIVQYYFVFKKYKNIQELFTENSKYIDEIII
jgi:hypothetical protein